jgi:hypothetical protein
MEAFPRFDGAAGVGGTAGAEGAVGLDSTPVGVDGTAGLGGMAGADGAAGVHCPAWFWSDGARVIRFSVPFFGFIPPVMFDAGVGEELCSWWTQSNSTCTKL